MKMKIRGKLQVVECIMISKLLNKDVYVVKTFNSNNVVAPNFSVLKKFINKELTRLKKMEEK